MNIYANKIKQYTENHGFQAFILGGFVHFAIPCDDCGITGYELVAVESLKAARVALGY